MGSAQDELIEYFENHTDEEIIADINAHTAKRQEAYGDIPKDKDCTKCPHAYKGESQGMITPCFDICDDALWRECDEPTRPFSMEEVDKAGRFIASVQIDDTGEPFE